MTRIPIDVTAPIACTAGGDELARRVEQLERLRGGLRAIERTEHGLLLRFAPRPELEEELERFVVDEKGCCQFWGFEIEDAAGLALRWDGPPDAQPLLDELLHAFQSNEPLTVLSGLL